MKTYEAPCLTKVDMDNADIVCAESAAVTSCGAVRGELGWNSGSWSDDPSYSKIQGNYIFCRTKGASNGGWDWTGNSFTYTGSSPWNAFGENINKGWHRFILKH